MVKDNIKKITVVIFKFIQNILLPFFLFLAYFIGFGVTFILTLFFKPKLIFDLRKNKQSFWEETKDSNENVNECEDES